MLSKASEKPAVLGVIDDDEDVRHSLTALLEASGFTVSAFGAAKEYLEAGPAGAADCLIVDVRMPDMDGLELQQELKRRGNQIPVIVVTGHGDIPLAVRAIKEGAVDFLEKPYDESRLLQAIDKALEQSRLQREKSGAAEDAKTRIGALTPREREILQLIAAGHPNKVIATKLQISPRTVEVHRARLMDKTQARSVSDLVRWAIAAGIMA